MVPAEESLGLLTAQPPGQPEVRILIELLARLA
jgi:hypothetical protein